MGGQETTMAHIAVSDGTNKRQDFRALRDQCLDSQTLFCDDTFPAQPESLGYKKLARDSESTMGVEWKRPKELQPNPKFTVGVPQRTDIRQGELGDCWLLAAIACLTLDKDIVARVVPPGQSFQENYAGIFHFKFWQYGEWVDVVIDDRLPTKDGKLLFLHSDDPLEFWGALLEKAYAKVNGSYEALWGGFSTEAFKDFTGGISEIYELEKVPLPSFKIIQKALNRGSLLAGTIYKEKENEVITPLNLVKGHVYSLTAAEEVHVKGTPVQLVRLRNPWGKVEWTGPWSDNSSEWDGVRPDESKLERSTVDGEFWMAYSVFLNKFSRLEICSLTPYTLTSSKVGRWSYCQFEGKWRVGSTAGGWWKYTDTFCSNPQFRIKLDAMDDDPHDGEDGCSFVVGLTQKHRRKQRRFGRELNTIGFTIYKIPDEYKGRSNVRLGRDVLRQLTAVAWSSYSKMREVCNRFKLPPGEYAIIPSTVEPDKKGSFILRIFFEKHAAASPMEEDINADVDKLSIKDSDVNPYFKRPFIRNFGSIPDEADRLVRTLPSDLYTDSEISAAELRQILNREVSQRTDIKTDGFRLETCRQMVGLFDSDESAKLGRVEFDLLWKKIQRYLEVFKRHDSDNSGTISSHEIRGAPTEAGFQLHSAVLEVTVARYADAESAIDFDCFVSRLIRLEILSKIFKKLDEIKEDLTRLG